MSTYSPTQDPSGSPVLDSETRACLSLWSEVSRVGLRDEARHYRKTGRFSEWLDKDSHHPGAFCWLCDLFGLDAETVRLRIHERASDENPVDTQTQSGG